MTNMPFNAQLDTLVRPLSKVLARDGFVEWHKTHADLFSHRLVPEKSYLEFCLDTENAMAPIESMYDLIVYSAVYGADNFVLFSQLLDLVQKQSSRSVRQRVRLNVIDYGCGQGIASLALLSHLRYRYLDIHLHLVEPSEVSLYAAERYVAAFSKRVKKSIRIHAHLCGIDALSDDVFHRPNMSTVHLFSSVLDMADSDRFNLYRLAQKIKRAPTKHLFLATSRDCDNAHKGFIRLQSHFPRARNLLGSYEIDARVPDTFSLVDCEGQKLPSKAIEGRALALAYNAS